MSLLTQTEDGRWFLELDVQPVEYWTYTTLVHEVVLHGPAKNFKDVHIQLMELFKEEGIQAYDENKSAFGVQDHLGRMWYFGFKDGYFSLGMKVYPDKDIKPFRKEQK